MRYHEPGRAGVWIALLALWLAPSAGAGPPETIPPDLSTLPSGYGAVFGSVEMRWDGLAGNYDVAEQEVCIFPESTSVDERSPDKPVKTIHAQMMRDKPFVAVLPAGTYEIAYMYRAPKGLSGWRPRHDMPPMSIGAHFDVQANGVTYIGRLAILMPTTPGRYVLSAGLMHVQPGGFAVEDARGSTIAALSSSAGAVLDGAPTRLARPPGDLQAGDLERVVAGDRVKVGARWWEVWLPPGAEPGQVEEENGLRKHITRFSLGPSSWANTTQGLEVVLWERDEFCLTPRAFYESMQGGRSEPRERWNVLAEGASGILFEVILPEGPRAPGRRDKAYGLYRVVVGGSHAVSTNYVVLGEPTEGARRAWQQALLTTRVKD